MSNLPSYQILRDVLAPYYVNEDGKVNELAIDVAIHFATLFIKWEEVLDNINADEQVVWSIYYVIVGAMTGKPVIEPDMYSAQKRHVRDEIGKRINKKLADQFDEINDSILYGKLRQSNQFYVDHEQAIIHTVLDDCFLMAQKALFKLTNADIAKACDVCKWRFLAKIALIVGGENKAFEIGAKILAMRDAQLRE